MTRPPLFLALEPVIEVLERLGVPNHVGGSVASSAVGMARTTLDVDLVADLRAEHVSSFVDMLRDQYYVSENAILEAVRRKACFNVIHLATMFKVDVFVLPDTPYGRMAFSRRQQGTLRIGDHSAELMIASPEDIVLNKLQWYQLGDEVSERQWHDILGVLRVQHARLDWKYMRDWAERLGLENLLLRAERETEIVE